MIVRQGGLRALGTLIAVVALALTVATHQAPPSPGPTSASVIEVGAAPAAGPARLGVATFYGEAFHGGTMADGARFDMDDASIAASNTWPLGVRLRLRRIAGSPWDATLSSAETERFFGRTIIVTVRDRGDFHHELDLSRAAFAYLARPEEGVIRVLIEPLD
ncbi:MAG: septal ring lytic transglycosylase RlpA family protein [Dehalococcoidia bacterium]